MNEKILEVLAPSRQSRLFETKKSFRFLFPGGTSSLFGADAALEGFRRAFGVDDDIALIIGSRLPAEPRFDWLQSLFKKELAPDVEYLDLPLDDQSLESALGDVDALIYPWASAPDHVLLNLAVAAEVPLIIPEDRFALSQFGHDCAYLVPCRAIEVQAGDGRMNRVDPQDLAGVLRQIQAEPEHAATKARRAKKKLAGHSLQGPDIDFAICWAGASLDFSGYAKTSRNMIPALIDIGVDASTHAFSEEENFVKSMLKQPQASRRWRQILERQPRGGLYIAFHPPFRQKGVSFMGHLKANNPNFAAHVAYTMFETDRLPLDWAAQLNVMDEVWVPSQFNYDTFLKSGVEEHKLKILPLGIDPAPFLNNQRVMEIPGRKAFNFLSIFDWSLRKGWDVLIEAWLRAFSSDDDVSLTIRAYCAIKDQDPIHVQIERKIRELGFDPETIPEIILIDHFVSEEDMPALYAAADAFVLPTRGEGWGMPLIEAMACGLPTIGTRGSAQLEFMTDQNSYLIDLQGHGTISAEQTRLNHFYEADHLWLEPDATHLAEIFRTVAQNPELARARGKRAQTDVVKKFSANVVATQLCDLAQDLMTRIQAENERKNEVSVLPEVLPNIAWSGPIYDHCGYGEEGRSFVSSLMDLGAALRLFPLSWSQRRAQMPSQLEQRLQAAESADFVAGQPVVVLYHDFGHRVARHDSAQANIARTMFETDSLPAAWVENLKMMDAVFVPSAFNKRSFAAAGLDADRIHVVPGSIDAKLYSQPVTPMELPTTASFKFLSIFDWSRRKGWDVLLRAYLSEFEAKDDVSLILKVWSSSGQSIDAIAAEIEDFIREDLGLDPDAIPDIVLLDREIDAQDMPRLYAAADCYVQPTRGEGWGRPIMEAMASGLPTLATRWGGNMEYMTSKNSFPIECAIEPCSAAAVAEAPWFAGQKWAEPCLQHLRHLLRAIREKRDIGRQVGQIARQEILRNYNEERVAKLMITAIGKVLSHR